MDWIWSNWTNFETDKISRISEADIDFGIETGVNVESKISRDGQNSK